MDELNAKACLCEHTDGPESLRTGADAAANLAVTRWIWEDEELIDCSAVSMSAHQVSDRLILSYMRPDGNYGINCFGAIMQ